MTKDIYGVLERNGDKNEICKCCGGLTVDQMIVTLTSNTSKFSGGGIIGNRKYYSSYSMIIITFQYM